MEDEEKSKFKSQNAKVKSKKKADILIPVVLALLYFKLNDSRAIR